MSNLQTQLLGARIEVKPRENYYSCFDSTREPTTGVVRTVAFLDEQTLLQIETDDGWIFTFSSLSNAFRVLKEVAVRPVHVQTARFRDLAIGTVFRFVDPELHAQPGSKLVKLSKNPGWAMPEGWDFLLPDDSHFWEKSCIVLNEKAPQPIPTFPMDEDLP